MANTAEQKPKEVPQEAVDTLDNRPAQKPTIKEYLGSMFGGEAAFQNYLQKKFDYIKSKEKDNAKAEQQLVEETMQEVEDTVNDTKKETKGIFAKIKALAASIGRNQNEEISISELNRLSAEAEDNASSTTTEIQSIKNNISETDEAEWQGMVAEASTEQMNKINEDDFDVRPLTTAERQTLKNPPTESTPNTTPEPTPDTAPDAEDETQPKTPEQTEAEKQLEIQKQNLETNLNIFKQFKKGEDVLFGVEGIDVSFQFNEITDDGRAHFYDASVRKDVYLDLKNNDFSKFTVRLLDEAEKAEAKTDIFTKQQQMVEGWKDNPNHRADEEQSKLAWHEIYKSLSPQDELKMTADSLRQSWAKDDGVGDDYPANSEQFKLQTGEALKQAAEFIKAESEQEKNDYSKPALKEMFAKQRLEMGNPYQTPAEQQDKYAWHSVYEQLAGKNDIVKQEVDQKRKAWAKADGAGADYPTDSEQFKLQTGEALRQIVFEIDSPVKSTEETDEIDELDTVA